MSEYLIKCENVKKIYGVSPAQVHALRGVSFTVERGEKMAIVGASGSGKSTLLQILGCLDTPTEGKYFLNEQDTGALDDNSLSELRGREIGFVFQAFHLFPRMTLLENIALPLSYQKVSKKIAFEKAHAALAQVKLAHRASHFPHEISGGEKQRGAIARAIVTTPKILLADEPTGNLDSRVKEEILDYLVLLATEMNMTIIMVTHDDKTAERMNRVLSIKDGEIYNDFKQ